MNKNITTLTRTPGGIPVLEVIANAYESLPKKDQQVLTRFFGPELSAYKTTTISLVLEG